MHELLQRLARVDLDTAVRSLLGFLDSVDPCFLGLIVGVLVVIGSRMVVGQPSLQSWGLRLAATAFLAYGGYLWFSGKVDDGSPLWKLGLRCGCAAGVVLAAAWIVLPMCSFACRRLRLALAVFLGYGAWAACTAEHFSTEQLSQIAVYALAASGLALVVAWIIDPFWCALSRHLFPPRPQQPGMVVPMVMETSVAQPVPRIVRTTMLAPATPMLACLEPAVPESHRRRDRARMQLELAYLQALPVITGWLPRPMFDDFLRRHLSDHLSPEEVEENARQLLNVLRQHQEQVHERGEFSSLEELTDWLLSEQQRIQALALEGPLKQTQLLDLHQRYLVLATRVVQKQTALTL